MDKEKDVVYPSMLYTQRITTSGPLIEAMNRGCTLQQMINEASKGVTLNDN